MTHDDAVASAADRIVHMVDGRVVDDDGWRTRCAQLNTLTRERQAGGGEASWTWLEDSLSLCSMMSANFA